MKKEQILLKQLQKAAEARTQLHFCSNGYYNVHTSEICSVANSPENSPKNLHNRWGLPYDHNLVSSIPDYINASPMEFNSRRYIAAQGPRSNTFAEFWNMVVEEKSSLIVSVTNEYEDNNNGYLGFKFNRFWPDCGSENYGTVIVLLHEEQLAKEWDDGRHEKIRKRRLKVQRGNHEQMVTHLHMENWPDNGVIHPESLIALRKVADEDHAGGPIVVHCAAGVGRTGTFIAYHSLYHDLQSEHPEFDIPERVHQMRKLRWGAMISDGAQYELLLEALKRSV